MDNCLVDSDIVVDLIKKGGWINQMHHCSLFFFLNNTQQKEEEKMETEPCKTGVGTKAVHVLKEEAISPWSCVICGFHNVGTCFCCAICENPRGQLC